MLAAAPLIDLDQANLPSNQKGQITSRHKQSKLAMAIAAENFLLPVNMIAMAVFMSACSVAAVLRRQPRESSGANSLYGRCWREVVIRPDDEVRKR
jgi:hypothetical protein